MESIFDRLTFTVEEAQQAIAEGKRKRTTGDLRICVCGHGARAHTSESLDNESHMALKMSGRFMCKPGRQSCPCKEFKAVLTASDPRKFIYRTDGPGSKHALSKGMAAVFATGGTLQWTAEAVCEVCKRADVPLLPVALSEYMKEVDVPTRRNYLLCHEDRVKIWHEANGTQPAATEGAVQ